MQSGNTDGKAEEREAAGVVQLAAIEAAEAEAEAAWAAAVAAMTSHPSPQAEARVARAVVAWAAAIEAAWAAREAENVPTRQPPQEARTRLTAAAPALLAACQELVALWQAEGGHLLLSDSPSIVRARAAIAKAID